MMNRLKHKDKEIPENQVAEIPENQVAVNERILDSLPPPVILYFKLHLLVKINFGANHISWGHS